MENRAQKKGEKQHFLFIYYLLFIILSKWQVPTKYSCHVKYGTKGKKLQTKWSGFSTILSEKINFVETLLSKVNTVIYF